MRRKLTRYQHALATVIHDAAGKIGHGGLIPSALAFELFRQIFNPHLSALKILKGIEAYDPTILRNLKNGFFFTQREPSSKEINSRTPAPSVITDDVLKSIAEQYKGKLPAGICAPSKPVLSSEVKKAVLARIAPPVNAAISQHLARRIEILTILIETQNRLGFINKSSVKTTCKQVEPGSDHEVIVNRMVKKGWLKKKNSGWRLTPAGKSLIKSHKKS